MLLSAIGHREIPIPEHIDIYHLTREMAPSEKTALQCVMEVDEQRIMLESTADSQENLLFLDQKQKRGRVQQRCGFS